MAAKKRQVSAETRVKLSQAAKKRKRGLKGTSLGGKFLSGAVPSFGGRRPIVNPSYSRRFNSPSDFDKINNENIRQSRARYEAKMRQEREAKILGAETGTASKPSSPRLNPAAKAGPANQGKDQEGPSSKTGTKTSPKGPKGKKHRGQRGQNASHTREFGQAVYADAARRAQSHPEEVAADLTRLTLERSSGQEVSRADFIGPSPVVSHALSKTTQMHKDQHWRDEGVYASSERKTPARFAKEDMSDSHRQEFDKLRNDPNSPFNKTSEGLPGDPKSARSRNRQRQYTDKLQDGWSHDAAIDYIQNAEERRGRSTGTPVKGRQQSRRGRGKTTTQQRTRGSKFESVNDKYRGKNEMEFGVSAGAASSLQELGNNNPDMSDRQLIQTQQAQRMSIQDEFEKNLMWAHETKRANLMGDNSSQGGRKSKEDDDRVVFFTTNLGSPAPSVPADSLIGQYIIRRRRNMMANMGYSQASLKGEFPRAVRDMHLLELSTGLSLGVEGRAGVYNETGFRKGTKTSKGYNKPTPLGSSILTDSQGSPLYDAQGRVRYSEGSTAPVNWQSPKVGLKIFIG